MKKPIKIGTRASKLALWQANHVKAQLLNVDPTQEIEIVPISTQGDVDKTTPLERLGGKGVFIKQIEESLLSHDVDIAVHSLKDITSNSPDDLILSAFLKPESQFDCIVSANPLEEPSLNALPKGAVVGTSSMRRKAILSVKRPDVICKDLRGNIDTRISHCLEGKYDAILLSTAGLIRLGYDDNVYQELSEKEMTPAPGQGVMAVQVRKSDKALQSLTRTISDQDTHACCDIEFEVLKRVGLDCQYPFGLYSQIKNDEWHCQVFIAKNLKTDHMNFTITAKLSESKEKATELGDFLKSFIGDRK